VSSCESPHRGPAQSISFRVIAWIATRHIARPKPIRKPTRRTSVQPAKPKAAPRTNWTVWCSGLSSASSM
jgi:hypothetical protein